MRDRAPELAREVGDLEAEHATISEDLHKFARVLANVLLEVEMPRDSFASMARAFIERERKHISDEEEVFLPAALAGLTEEDWDDISARTQATRDPLLERAKIRFGLIRDDEDD